MPLKNHDRLGNPRCEFCGSINVKELEPEGSPKHRHVCLNKDCVEIASNRRRILHGLEPLYPEVMDKP